MQQKKKLVAMGEPKSNKKNRVIDALPWNSGLLLMEGRVFNGSLLQAISDRVQNGALLPNADDSLLTDPAPYPV